MTRFNVPNRRDLCMVAGQSKKYQVSSLSQQGLCPKSIDLSKKNSFTNIQYIESLTPFPHNPGKSQPLNTAIVCNLLLSFVYFPATIRNAITDNFLLKRLPSHRLRGMMTSLSGSTQTFFDRILLLFCYFFSTNKSISRKHGSMQVLYTQLAKRKSGRPRKGETVPEKAPKKPDWP